jgi:hypothetical protein
VRVRGTLRREGDAWSVDVTAPPEFLPPDRERLEKAVAGLNATDSKSRSDLGNWGLRQAQLYADAELANQALAVIGEAITIEADRPANAAPDRQIALARGARERKVPEPAPSALVHRAYRARLGQIDDPAAAEAFLAELRSLLPETAQSPQPAADLGAVRPAYQKDPAAAYRQADPATRAALDRLLLGDTTQKALELALAADPTQALALATRAEQTLPDRPDVARSLIVRALQPLDVGALRRAEVLERAELARKIGQADLGDDLVRRWLDNQRKNLLRPTDAEGRLLLAGEYETLLKDRATWQELVEEARQIDPDSEAIKDAYRTRNYRLVGDRWVPPEGAAAATPGKTAESPVRPAAAPGSPDPYRGLSRAEILQQLGKPDRIARVATQGQIREQWSFSRAGNKWLYINFTQRAGDPRATVLSSSD